MEHTAHGPTPNRIAQAMGKPEVIRMIAKEIAVANAVTGNGLDESAVMTCAELIYQRWRFKPITGLKMAFYRGINGGKMFGKLTYPILSQWMEDMEEAMEEYNYQKHIASKE